MSACSWISRGEASAPKNEPNRLVGELNNAAERGGSDVRIRLVEVRVIQDIEKLCPQPPNCAPSQSGILKFFVIDRPVLK